MRDLPPALRPDIHVCIRKLRSFDRNRWHSAGVRVKKLAGFAQPVFEARLNRGDRLIFTLHSAVSDAFEGPHIILWCAGHHDDAVRNAGRRMGLQDPVVEARTELAAVPEAWDRTLEQVDCHLDAESLGPPFVPSSEPSSEPGALRGFTSLVEISEADIDRWAESQLDPILHLSAEQRALTRAGEDQPVFLRGGVGTGKTTVLLYRMLKLLMAGSIARPAFLTYSRTLAGWCRSVFERLPGWDRYQVEFTSLSGLLRARFGEARGGKRLFKRAWGQVGLRGDAEAAWWELQRLRGSAAFHGRQPRTGDELPYPAATSLRAGYTAYRKLLDNAPDVLDLAWNAYEYYVSPSASANLPFDAIFIDEAQDLTPIEWLVCILMGDRPRLAFFCADEAQDIRDTQFSWDGVEAAMRLIGHRAPTFSCVDLHGNRRNASAIASFLAKISERFDLQASTQDAGPEPGPTPLVCVGTLDILEKAARQARCPVLLDLTARTDRDRGKLFWSLDLDHIKGLEFQVLPLWAPAAVWPREKHVARKLYTAASRAIHALAIVTDGATVGHFEQLGARRVSPRELAEFLAAQDHLIARDRESLARWKMVTYSQATRWVHEGVCSWSDFRSLLPRYSDEASLSMATHWVQDGLCTWEPFQDRLGEWARTAGPDEALTWVRDGLCLPEEFAPRVAGWVQTASFAEAVTWVDAGLLRWADFRHRVRAWIPHAPLPVAAAWVASDVCTWLDLQDRLPGWMPEATFDQAQAWVEAAAMPWEAMRARLPDWYAVSTVEVAASWVRDELCTWHDVRARLPSWLDSVPFDVAQEWVDAGLCTWTQLRHRLREWIPEASFEQASVWVETGLCRWTDFPERVKHWAPMATPEQAIQWMQAGHCSPSCVWEQVPRWRPSLTFQQANKLVDADACSWGTLAPRLPAWRDEASFVQACEWVDMGLLGWSDFEHRLHAWKPCASLHQASAWVQEGLCSWKDFADDIDEWTPHASLEQASAWVNEGLASWEAFRTKLHGWAGSADPRTVEMWRNRGLISRQVARAARMRRR